jgi:hypothetical protein
VRILEHLDAIVVLDDGTPEATALGSRLAAAGCAPVVVDLAAPEGWRPSLAPLVAQPRHARATGVLVLSPVPSVERDLWRSQDRLVEQLEWRDWEIAFLGHVAGTGCIRDDMRPDLFECDAVPPGLTAIALRWRTLDSAIELMPDAAIDGPLSPTDWLTIVAWIAHALPRAARPLFAWPPLLHAPAPSPGAAAGFRT